MFRLAHLSDPHLAPLPRTPLSELASKRLLGYVNWRRGRHKVHRTDVVEAICRDLRGQQPDHIAVTGDLVNIALPSEIQNARRWLERLGDPQDVSLVPGNHDAYVAAAVSLRDAQWAPFMRGDGAGDETSGLAPSFPYVRRRGPVALVGLSTAVPTPPFMASGRLGAAQITRAAAILAELGAAGVFRVVLLHHPPSGKPSAWHKRLADGADFCRMLASVGAELVLHGHDHVHAQTRIPATRIPVVGVPSASAIAGGHHHAAAYNIYRIGGEPGAWTCEAMSRGPVSAGTIGVIGRFDLSDPVGMR